MLAGVLVRQYQNLDLDIFFHKQHVFSRGILLFVNYLSSIGILWVNGMLAHSFSFHYLFYL